MAEVSEQPKEDDCLFLAPGFRFHPTDEEIITHYLSVKIADQSFNPIAMGEVDLNKCEPWHLPSKAKMGEKEWYFFSQKERRYPTGMRTNRATESGYWKATGKDREIHKVRGVLVGMKKTLVFYKGRAPRGEKTNWVMHEFRLEGNYPHHYKDDWVVVRVLHKNEGTKRNPLTKQAITMEDDSLNSQVPSLNSLHNFGYLHKDEAMVRALVTANGERRIEQFSNSMVSTSRDDTGLSNDQNAEISSYGDGPSSVPLFDFENIWNF